MTEIPVVVYGGTGYVAGELLRILAGHPSLRVAAVLSTSQAGEPVTRAFPHLQGTGADAIAFEPLDAIDRHLRPGAPAGLFFATPRGATAPLVEAAIAAARARDARPAIVDLSADLRADPSFQCAVPEHARPAGSFVAHPGCFTTATVIAAAPFVAADLVEDEIFVSAVTGSSGSGRTPGSGTHHPERRSNLHAYAVLEHRHEAEMRRLLGALRGGRAPEVAFVPHSGPFVRGIHATLSLRLRARAPASQLLAHAARFYQGAPFVSVGEAPPRLVDVIGTNRCALGVASRGRTLVVTSAIDNLVKGAAGGAVQWMNALFGLPQDAGLRLPGIGWV